MSEDTKKPWALAVGSVQSFVKEGVRQPAVKQGNANGQPVWNLTIKTFTKGEFVDVAIWGEFAHVAPSIQDGFILFVDGPVEQREYNGKIYNKINAKRLGVLPLCVPQEREVVNQVAAPVAAPVAAAVDPVAQAQAALAAAQAAVLAVPAAPAGVAEVAAPFSF